VELATWQHGLFTTWAMWTLLFGKNALGQAIEVNLTQILTNYKNSNVGLGKLAKWNWKRVK
jgi:hypothetical protein